MMKLWIVLAAMALCAGAGQRAQAQSLRIQFHGQPEEGGVPPPPGVDDQDWADEEPPPPRPARTCQKMCADDFSPCDPIYFKTEDGRCDGVHFGR